MAESDSLVLEILKRLQNEFSLMREDMRGLRAEMTAVKHHIAAFMAHEVTQDGEIASIKARLERIEQRLNRRGSGVLRVSAETGN
ncbi:MAG TPA: hypothetical protein VMM55_07685 [Thermohalobaculum sp.]|nr:hypothetical protein [Thermohalobaculum sp.]